jgi:tryptophan-rich sensory protein
MSDDRPTSEQGPPAEGQPGPSGYPEYPSAPSPYPSPYPSAPPSGAGAPASTVPQPPSIRNAVRLMWVGAAVSLISLVVTLATLGSLKQQIRDSVRNSGQNVKQSTVDAAFAGAIVFSVVIALIAIGLWLWMAWKNGQGRQWARIVATVLGVLNVIFTLLSFVGNRATGGARILSVIDLVIAIAILVLLWRKESTDFYEARSARQYT